MRLRGCGTRTIYNVGARRFSANDLSLSPSLLAKHFATNRQTRGTNWRQATDSVTRPGIHDGVRYTTTDALRLFAPLAVVYVHIRALLLFRSIMNKRSTTKTQRSTAQRHHGVGARGHGLSHTITNTIAYLCSAPRVCLWNTTGCCAAVAAHCIPFPFCLARFLFDLGE